MTYLHQWSPHVTFINVVLHDSQMNVCALTPLQTLTFSDLTASCQCNVRHTASSGFLKKLEELESCLTQRLTGLCLDDFISTKLNKWSLRKVYYYVIIKSWIFCNCTSSRPLVPPPLSHCYFMSPWNKSETDKAEQSKTNQDKKLLEPGSHSFTYCPNND